MTLPELPRPSKQTHHYLLSLRRDWICGGHKCFAIQTTLFLVPLLKHVCLCLQDQGLSVKITSSTQQLTEWILKLMSQFMKLSTSYSTMRKAAYKCFTEMMQFTVLLIHPSMQTAASRMKSAKQHNFPGKNKSIKKKVSVHQKAESMTSRGPIFSALQL